ncbi:MAG: hypothetical protein IPO62_07780 [Saprospiraceae bacterium]|nr:hypothetical protein [Saprospiraceae bacterium]MBK9630953.1 hypothetical protein [Saprospiraceae bacterium]
MKYYYFDFDWDNFPNGSGIDTIGGELLENVELKDKFWAHFTKRLVIGYPQSIPIFNFLEYMKGKKFLAQDYMDNLFHFGLVISDKLKIIIESSYLSSHLFEPVVIKFKEKLIEDYWFFCLTESNIDAINYEKSYFFIPNNYESVPKRNLYKENLVKFSNSNELYTSTNSTIHGLSAYSIKILESKKFDILNLGTLIEHYYLFSEELVEVIQDANITNLVFKEFEHIQ